jgi:predicted RNA binding protein YcfA (HicA-like mRNA interferase family)
MPPQVKRKDFVKVLEHLGLHLDRIKGDHSIYKKKGLLRPVVITKHKEVPLAHISTNIKTLGITMDEFFDILNRVK